MINLLRIHSLIAFRNIIRSPRRSALTIVAIAFGLFCLIVFQALKDGLRNEMVSSTLNLDTGTLQIHAKGYEVNLAFLANIPNLNKVTSALAQTGLTDFTLRIKAPALILAGAKSSSVILTGIKPEAERKVTFIADKMVVGAYLPNNNLAVREILLGQILAQSLGVTVGDTVNLMAQGSFAKPVFGRFTIKGLYKTSLASFDRTHAYLPLATAQSFLQAEGVISEIAVKTKEDEAAHHFERLSSLLPSGAYQVRKWQQILPDLEQIIELNDATMNLLILIVFAIVALGIANTMTTVIFERFREIGTISAIGATPAGIIGLIILESLGLGVIAAILGGSAGLVVCHYLHIYGIDLSHFISNNHYFAAGYRLRADLVPKDFIAAITITLITALLSGLYPAWKAANLDPAKAINHS